MKGATDVNFNRGIATFRNISFTQAGTYTLAVTDPAFTGAGPLQVTEIILPGVTTIPTPPAMDHVVGTVIPLTVHIKSTAPSSVAFTGSLSIIDQNNATLGVAAVSPDGIAKFLLTHLAAGTYACTLVYPGDANHTAAVSSRFVLTVTEM